ncbi:MAG: hypothetical protein N2C14_17295, partial [Planctomycetales bacterium]
MTGNQSKLSFHSRCGLALTVVGILLAAPILFGVHHAMNKMDNNVRQWLPDDIKETREYNWRCEHFPPDESIFVSWEGCELDDVRLERLAAALVPQKDSANQDEDVHFFHKARTGTATLEKLMGEPFRLSREDAVERLRGTLIALDGNGTCAVVKLTEEGNDNRESAVEAVYRIAEREIGLASEEIHLAGEPVTNAVVDQESRAAVRQWVALAWLTSLIVAAVGLCNGRLIAMIFITALDSAASA